MHTFDEGIRPSTYKKVAALKPMFQNCMITPATSSLICDGASALLICNETGLKTRLAASRENRCPMVGADPVIMLEGPVPATGEACELA